jgi:hypothetical protein
MSEQQLAVVDPAMMFIEEKKATKVINLKET